MAKTKIMIFTILTILLVAPMFCNLAFADTVPTFSLSSSVNQIQYSIPAGTTFNGSISTTGLVRFWVSAPPTQTEIVNLGLIDKSATFSFLSNQSGTYTFNFENELSNTVQVSFSYTANPQLPGSANPSNYLFIALIIITIGGSVVIFLAIRRKQKQISNIQKRQHQA